MYHWTFSNACRLPACRPNARPITGSCISQHVQIQRCLNSNSSCSRGKARPRPVAKLFCYDYDSDDYSDFSDDDNSDGYTDGDSDSDCYSDSDQEDADALRRLRNLASYAVQNGLEGSDLLEELEQNQERWHREEGLSMKAFKQVVADHAICLSDLQEYGSKRELRALLREDPERRILLAQAKRYPYVKMCLITL
ncbi:hypothetical protein ABBQ38_007809 [Trebouxia sp. C0009 RCD-2024]